MKTFFNVSILILFVIQTTKAQFENYYFQITDTSGVPEQIVIVNDSIHNISFRNNAIESIFQNFSITKFEKCFPNEVTGIISEIYWVRTNNDSLFVNLQSFDSITFQIYDLLPEHIPLYVPNDFGLTGGFLAEQPELELINAPQAWDHVTGGPIIGVVDFGFFPLHEDLTDQILNIRSNMVTNPIHGTAIAGLMATTDNNTGISSVSFNSPLILSIQRDALEIEQIANQGARVINMSYGKCLYSPLEEVIYQRIIDNGTVLVAGAGNGVHTWGGGCGVDGNAYNYPASYANVLSVSTVGHKFPYGTKDPILGKTNWEDVHDLYPNLPGAYVFTHNNKVDIVAPGYDVLTLNGDNNNPVDYYHESGTSLSAPLVAGACALVLAADFCLSAHNVIEIIKTTADNSIYNIPENQQYIGLLGSGRLDVEAAVLMAQNYGITAPIVHNTTWNTEKYVKGTLAIQNQATLTINSLVRFASGSKIIIEPGASLIVDGGTLTNSVGCKDEFWGGIEIHGDKNSHQFLISQGQRLQGYLELKNGATISNARTAVYVGDPTDNSKSGGIIRAFNSNFKNNLNSVVFSPYSGYSINYPNYKYTNFSFFRNCDFSFDIEPDNDSFDSFIWFKNVNGIDIAGCRFEVINPNNKTLNSVGIKSLDAGFKVRPLYSGGNVIKSEFHNLNYGVKAGNTSSINTFIIDRTSFFNNTVGIELGAVNNAKITRCSLDISNPNQVIQDGSVGISIINSTGYQIDDNYLTTTNSSNVSAYGIWAYNTGSSPNEIYDNTVENLFMGIFTHGVNRGISASPLLNYTGLEIKCNDFNSNGYDILVFNSPVSGVSSSAYGIKERQGDGDHSAGNEFDQSGNQSESHYYIETSKTVTYHGHIASIYGEPSYFTQYKLIPGKDGIKDCASSFAPQGGNNPDPFQMTSSEIATANSIYSQEELNYANLYFSYDQLIDGGSTPSLLTQIQESWSQDAWLLRSELLEVSPYLSEDALVEAANSGVLPKAMLLEVCLANPDVTKNEELLYYLQYDIPNPLDESMANLIISNWGQETALTVLEENLGESISHMEKLNNNIITHFLNDSTGFSYDSIEYYMGRNSLLSRRYEIVNMLLDRNLNSGASQALLSIENSLSEHELLNNEFSRFEDWVEMKQDLNDENIEITEIDSSYLNSLLTLSENNDLAGTISKNILYHVFDLDYHYSPGEISLGQGKIGIADSHLKNSPFDVKVYPNPAESFVNFDLSKAGFGSMHLKIVDQNGGLIETQICDSKKPHIVIDTRKYSAGVYLYQVIGENGNIKSGRFSVIK